MGIDPNLNSFVFISANAMLGDQLPFGRICLSIVCAKTLVGAGGNFFRAFPSVGDDCQLLGVPPFVAVGIFLLSNWRGIGVNNDLRAIDSWFAFSNHDFFIVEANFAKI